MLFTNLRALKILKILITLITDDPTPPALIIFPYVVIISKILASIIIKSNLI